MRGPVLLTCPKGVAPLLAEEIRARGVRVVSEEVAAVEVETDFAGACVLCLHSRLAHRVLVPVTRARVRNADGLYGALVRYPWERHVVPDSYVRVHGFVRTESIRDERFAFLTVKDAVVDRVRERCGRRPDSGPDDRGVNVYVHWVGEEARVYFDLAGPPLSRRGYRRQGGVAPLKEGLAAAVLMGGGYDGAAPLVNPMCGAGTLAIEAALMARRQAPGLLREHFGFAALRDHQPEVWRKEVFEARRAVRPAGEVPAIVASDADPGMVELARANAERAGVGELIRFEVCDFRETPIPEGPAWVALNPEYGKRMGVEEELEGHYRDIGAWLRGLNTGGRGLVITGNLPLAKRFGLKLAGKRTLYNGAIECRLLMFDLCRPGGR